MRFDTDATIQAALQAQGVNISRSIDAPEYILEYNGKETRLSDVDVYLVADRQSLLDLLATKIMELKHED